MLKHSIIKPFFLALLLLFIILGVMKIIAWGWVFIVLSCWLGITTWGTFDIRLSYFVNTFYKRQHSDNKSLSLTFDDGPTPFTAELLDILAQYNAKATFFCIGKQIEKYPHIFKRILAEGHTLGNHTMNHSRSFGFLSADAIVQEITSCDAEINDLLAFKTKLFRPPFGVTNPSVAEAVKQTKHQIIGWSNRSLDTLTNDENKIFERVSRKLVPGDIVLLHDTSQSSVNAVNRLLEYMKMNNLESVTVDELLALEAYV